MMQPYLKIWYLGLLQTSFVIKILLKNINENFNNLLRLKGIHESLSTACWLNEIFMTILYRNFFKFEEDDDETDDGLLDISHQLGSLSIGVGLSGRPPEPLTEIEEISKENILQEFQQARSEQRCKVY